MPCCARCGRKVFNTDKRVGLCKVWHTFCFTCYNCCTPLDACSLRSVNGEIFCKCCYTCLFDCSSCSAKNFNICDKYICESVSTPTQSMPRCASCCKPNVYCLKPVCPQEPCCKTACGVSKRCSPNLCCSRCPPPNPCPVPRETANYYNRNHKRCKCGTCCQGCVQDQQPCRRKCSPCTVLERCPPKSCCTSSKACCEPAPCDPCPPKSCCTFSKSCCEPAPCDPCPPEPRCTSYCNPQRRCIYYPPIKCCEPYPSEIICVEPSCNDPPRKCCPGSGYCTCCKSKNRCEMIACCQRCCQTVYPVERIPAAGGVYHTCCFTCYCCGMQLDVTKCYENCGEIYCKGCYRRLFGLESYGL